ncbi:hypothetical protein KR222_003432, partial [Zaprionus bogoriensis]
MPKLILYGMDISPPVRACLLTLHALELPFEYRKINLLAGEQNSKEYTKKNPQRTVPLLEDGQVLITDSHAICSYLVDKYGKTDELYPKELVKRAHVQQRLYFDASVLFMSLKSISASFFLRGETLVPQEKVDNVRDGCRHLETFLGESLYVTGNSLTIADLCCVATVSSMESIVDINAKTYPKIGAWLDRMRQLPYYEQANA